MAQARATNIAGWTLVLAFALLSFRAQAQSPVDIVLAHGLEEIDSPGSVSHKAEEWERKFALDKLPVHVRVEKGRLELAQRVDWSPFPPRYDTPSVRYVLARTDGFAAGLDAEFKDGRPRRRLAVGVSSIVPRGGELLLFTGPIDTDFTGAIYRVEHPETNPEATLLARIPDAPFVVVENPRQPERSQLYIVGYSTLMSFARNGKLAVLHRSPLWAGRYPKSAVIYRDHLVIGSSTGVVVAWLRDDRVQTVRYFATKGRSVRLR